MGVYGVDGHAGAEPGEHEPAGADYDDASVGALAVRKPEQFAHPRLAPDRATKNPAHGVGMGFHHGLQRRDIEALVDKYTTPDGEPRPFGGNVVAFRRR